MKQREIKIEGIATISNEGFRFDSGMPSNEPVIDEEMKMRGTLKVTRNACADFVSDARVILPPQMWRVAEGADYKVRRSSRNYIIQLKVPVVERRAVSQKRLEDMVPVVMGEITLDRKELMDV